MSSENEYVPEEIEAELIEGDLVVQEKTENLPAPTESLSTEEAFEIGEAKEILKQLRDKGLEGVDHAFTLMEASEHPRSVETFSGLLKTVAEITREVVDLQTVKKELLKPTASEKGAIAGDGNSVQNNTIFVGSTEELRRMLKGNE